ncbi:MAG: bacillithiol biosynthesis deacetylase BshB1 [Planctomycetota bacterium]|jgi:bacillithiol biosynthesis deacetylase BshB1
MKSVAEPAQLPACDVLAFGPHPDDIEIACGGTLLLLQQKGTTVALVDCTRGEMGSRGTVEDRDREAEAAGNALGVAARCNLGLPDTGIRTDDEATNRVVAAIRAVQPKLIFAPHSRDVHPDHSNAAELIGRAHFLSGLRNYQPSLGKPHRARTLLRYPGNQPIEPTFVVDISDFAEKKAEVVSCYASQLSPSDIQHLTQGLDLLERTIVREQATGTMIAVRAGEGFWHDGPLAAGDLSWLLG